MGEAGATVLLVVDDDPDVRTVLRMMLELWGFLVLEAADGLAALELLALHAIDGVLLDLGLPELDGESTLARLRGTAPDLPVLLCSGYGKAPPHVSLTGATRFLQKPFGLADLRAALSSLGFL